ncbi:hypothetical protein WJX75_002160 [Coccomyxa subellipsoidea]|uniref:PLOD1-3-like GT domain-containing protein n=1 Tax=Coccomyxa subellipsoidea TaxID=248742 RepID=A0ABR2Z2K8_9CHLO
MLVDAFDVVIQGSVPDILAEYEALGSPGILFSSEANCWPPMLETEGYCELARVRSNKSSRYLNSGGVIGRAALWKHKYWFQKHLPMYNKTHFSFRVNSAGKHEPWSELCGTF